MHEPAQSGVRQVITNVLNLFTRRPFYILIPILAGALVGPGLVRIGFGARFAGIVTLVVIVLLMLYLGSAPARRACHTVVSALRGQRQ